jgi:hypothetical protein
VAAGVLSAAGRPPLQGRSEDPHQSVLRGELQKWLNDNYAGKAIDIVRNKPEKETLRLLSLCYVLYWTR